MRHAALRADEQCIKPSVKSFVIDAEAVAYDLETKKLMPFQDLSRRKRKDVRTEDITVRVHLFAFDLLFLNGEVSRPNSRESHPTTFETPSLCRTLAAALTFSHCSIKSCANVASCYDNISSLSNQSLISPRLRTGRRVRRFRPSWRRV